MISKTVSAASTHHPVGERSAMAGVVCLQNLEAVRMATENKIHRSLAPALLAESSVDVIKNIAQSFADCQCVSLRPLGLLRDIGGVMQGQDPATCAWILM